ncbi:MAG: hypothetical protein PVG65_00155 [Candidatus Thorarchaeota archaeon]|jgi:hypothetical protein
MLPTFDIGQEAYYVMNEKIYVVKIRAIIKRIDANGQVIKYEVEDYNGKTREVSGAYLVADFESAKRASLNNWNQIIERVTADITNQKKISFKEAQKLYQKAMKKKRKNRR